MSQPLVEIVDEVLTELSGVRRTSINTVEAYKRDLFEFVEFCKSVEKESINQITERNIRHFVIHLNEKKSIKSKNTIARKLSALRLLFKYALKNNIIETNPIAKIPNPKIQRKLPETLNLDSYQEIFRLLSENSEFDNLRTKAIFELLYGCAFRVSELCSLNVYNLDFSGMSIRVMGKGSKERIVPLGTKSLPIIKEYLASINHNNSSPLFVDKNGGRINRFEIYNLVKKYIEKVSDIKKKSPHILRHSAATHMLDNEADIMAVKEILGHENLSTTQIYTHVSIERLKKSYKKAHPKS